MATQLWPADKLQFGSFSYTKATIKENVTYPIVPNCPIINVDEGDNFDYQNIPVGTFFIVHFSYYNWWWQERLYLRVPDEANDNADSGLGFIANRGYEPGGVK